MMMLLVTTNSEQGDCGSEHGVRGVDVVERVQVPDESLGYYYFKHTNVPYSRECEAA